jgi:hypothetical protein
MRMHHGRYYQCTEVMQVGTCRYTNQVAASQQVTPFLPRFNNHGDEKASPVAVHRTATFSTVSYLAESSLGAGPSSVC